MGAVTWAGTVAAALIAVGTVLRWTVRRVMRSARWVSAVVELPAKVDRLSCSVDALTRALTERPSTVLEPPCSTFPHRSAGT